MATAPLGRKVSVINALIRAFPTCFTAAGILLPRIQDTRKAIDSLKLDKRIPIGNAEAGYFFNDQVLEAVDYGVGLPARLLHLISSKTD